MSIYRQFLFELRYIPHSLHLVADFKQKSSRFFRSTAYLEFSTPAECRTHIDYQLVTTRFDTFWKRYQNL
jgi:hypothetical protein